MKTLGILGGMSPESTVSYYLNINRAVNQALGGNSSAKLLLSSVNFEEIVQCQNTANWDLAGKILAKEAKQLQSIGAKGILIATNTMHKVADVVQDAISIPLLHILDVVADNIKAQKLSKVALLGTHYTMADSFYIDGLAKRGIETIVPDELAKLEIHRIIFEELCLGKTTEKSKSYYLNVIDVLTQQGIEGVILGCTEIGLLLSQTDLSMPIFDTTQLHSQMAVDFILEGSFKSK